MVAGLPDYPGFQLRRFFVTDCRHGKSRTIVGLASAFVFCILLFLFFADSQQHRIVTTTSQKSNEESSLKQHRQTLLSSCHSESPKVSDRPSIGCVTGKPCEYSDVLDFRIIVITYNRAVSLLKLLKSLDELELDGDRAALEIWLDVNERGEADQPTLKTAQSFTWSKGITRVHLQTSHAGIRGQWIDTWRPRPESPEIGLILEDDISVSPMAYRWLKAVHKAMANRTDFAGASLTSDQMSILHSNPKGPLAAPKNETILMYKCFGTWGFSPKPEHWRRFQDWFHLHEPSVAPSFRPYVPGTLPSEWYIGFEAQGTAQHMWEMWFIHYMHIEQLLCVYNNLGVYTGNKESCLCINRREVGLHNGSKGPEDLCKLLRVWRDEFINFPRNVVRLHWDGTPMQKPHYF